MDMHHMTFPDHAFDVIFACHSLEHAYDVDVALSEWARVTKPGGVWAIEVPIGFPTTRVDRHDFGSRAGLQARCAPYAPILLHGSETRGAHGVARVIVQTPKGEGNGDH